jgi:hypothetical protein
MLWSIGCGSGFKLGEVLEDNGHAGLGRCLRFNGCLPWNVVLKVTCFVRISVQGFGFRAGAFDGLCYICAMAHVMLIKPVMSHGLED